MPFKASKNRLNLFIFATPQEEIQFIEKLGKVNTFPAFFWFFFQTPPFHLLGGLLSFTLSYDQKAFRGRNRQSLLSQININNLTCWKEETLRYRP